MVVISLEIFNKRNTQHLSCSTHEIRVQKEKGGGGGRGRVLTQNRDSNFHDDAGQMLSMIFKGLTIDNMGPKPRQQSP
jgi:hypothetical protein